MQTEAVKECLSKKPSIRKLFKEYSIAEVETVINRMTGILDEMKESEAKKADLNKEKEASINEIMEIMKQSGLNVNDLGKLSRTASRKPVAKFTFVYETESGEAVEWTGSKSGRKPKAFQDYLTKTGKKAEECIAV